MTPPSVHSESGHYGFIRPPGRRLWVRIPATGLIVGALLGAGWPCAWSYWRDAEAAEAKMEADRGQYARILMQLVREKPIPNWAVTIDAEGWELIDALTRVSADLETAGRGERQPNIFTVGECEP